MKKLLIAIFICLSLILPSQVFAINKTLTMFWQQDSDSLEVMSNGGGWNVYVSDTEGGPYTLATDVDGNKIFITYDGVPASDYTSNQTILFDGNIGTTTIKYFTLKAVTSSGVESSYSNEASASVEIPVGVPFSFIIKVN